MGEEEIGVCRGKGGEDEVAELVEFKKDLLGEWPGTAGGSGKSPVEVSLVVTERLGGGGGGPPPRDDKATGVLVCCENGGFLVEVFDVEGLAPPAPWRGGGGGGGVPPDKIGGGAGDAGDDPIGGRADIVGEKLGLAILFP